MRERPDSEPGKSRSGAATTHRYSQPNKFPWPPVLLVSAIAAGWLLGKYVPVLAGMSTTGYYPFSQAQRWLGWLMVGGAVATDLWVMAIFRKNKTNIRPDRPAEHFVKTGPFAFSRNPIYVGNVAIIAGLAMIKGSIWYLLLVPVIFYLLQELAIKPEEEHLALRFENQWTSYASVVRRWF